jgi:hypothetical protein
VGAKSARLLTVFALLLGLLGSSATSGTQSSGTPSGGDPQGLRFRVTIDTAVPDQYVSGRLYVMISRRDSPEPRFQVSARGIPIWGKDITAPKRGMTIEVDSRDEGVFGFPLSSMRDLPPGEYHVQALLNVYERFERSDGSVVELPMPCGDGQNPFRQPGNLVSDVVTMDLQPTQGRPMSLRLTQAIEPVHPIPPDGNCQQGNPPDTEHVKYFKIQSDLLTEFWGRPMYIGADVLLPEGYNDPAEADRSYPVVYRHGHYPYQRAPYSFREDGGNAFSRWWLSDDVPRMIAVEFRHENPYYDDSYAVNSANLGPYGDAIAHEMLAAIDERFRTVPEPWARALTGGSTGGWASLAQQVFYPEIYDGVWSLCPDSPDFRAFQVVNVYEDANAYWTDHEWYRVARPSNRRINGDIQYTMEDENHWELALGTRSRSTKQWDIWEAVHGPQGPDGYPARIWDKDTGLIDPEVAAAWRDMDIRHYLETNWSSVGPLLKDKIHVYMGDADTYFLDSGSEYLRAFLENVENPESGAEFQFGRRQPHCWSPYTSPELLTLITDRMIERAPQGSLEAWQR